jgi:hypothetical protein
MTYRTAGRTTKTGTKTARKTAVRKAVTRKVTKTRRAAKSTRTTKSITPKPGQAFSVPVGRKGVTPSAWYFGR